MDSRFNFNAVITGFYCNDNDEDTTCSIYLEDIDVPSGGDFIGIDRYRLIDAIKQQYPSLEEKYLDKMMKVFEDNSYSYDSDYLSIKADKILQSTGFRSKNGTLIYEGDHLNFKGDTCIIKFYEGHYTLYNTRTLKCSELTKEVAKKLIDIVS